MVLSKKERKKLRLEKQREQGRQATQESVRRQESLPVSHKRNWKIPLFVGLIVVFSLASFSVYSYMQPGPLDEFTRCVAESGVMYGASWCQYTDAQKGMFGKDKRNLAYADYTEYPNEEYGKISRTPTWVINGNVLENVQSLERIAQESGCELP